MIGHAYALIPAGIGRFRAVHLEGVIADKVNDLEPEGRGEPVALGVQRVTLALTKRARRGK